MKKETVTFIFIIILCMLLSTIAFPPFFKIFNRISPWILGIPFSAFWIFLVCILMSLTLIVWFIIENKRGDLD